MMEGIQFGWPSINKKYFFRKDKNMYKTTVTYTDFEGLERTEDLYFNLTTTELVKLENSMLGGLQKRIENMMQRHDVPTIMQTMEDVIRMSYGVKSPDGRKFIKNDEVYEDFLQSGAYDAFYMSVVTDAEKGSEFINGIIPADLREKVAQLEKDYNTANFQEKVIEMSTSVTPNA